MKIFNIIHEVTKNYRVVIDQDPVLVSNFEFVVMGKNVVDDVMKALDLGWRKADFEKIESLPIESSVVSEAYEQMAIIPKSSLAKERKMVQFNVPLDPLNQIIYSSICKIEEARSIQESNSKMIKVLFAEEE